MADIFGFTDEWNDVGTTFSGIKLDVTDTASAAGSLLIDLQVGGGSQFAVDKAGSIFGKEGANRWKLGGRTATTTGVPYFRSEAADNFTALDIIPNGTGGADQTGVAWIHILNTDLQEEEGHDWQALLLTAQTDKVCIGSDFGASSTNLPLHIGGSNIVFQDRGKTPSTSFAQLGSTGLQIGVVGAAKQSLTPSDVRLASDIELRWSATTDVFGTLDTSLSRSAAGILQVGGASADASGTLLASKIVLGGGTVGSDNFLVTGSATVTGTLRSNTNIWLAGNSAPLFFGASLDAAISRNAAGVVQIGTNGANSNGVGLATAFQTVTNTVSGLPTAAAGNAGQRRHVTDANATTFGTTVAGGGSNIVPVFSTGAAWIIG